jgi:hypothetical protein
LVRHGFRVLGFLGFESLTTMTTMNKMMTTTTMTNLTTTTTDTDDDNDEMMWSMTLSFVTSGQFAHNAVVWVGGCGVCVCVCA